MSRLISDLSDLAPSIISTVGCRLVMEPKYIHKKEHCASPGDEIQGDVGFITRVNSEHHNRPSMLSTSK